MAQKICSFCGARYDDSEKTCPYCGSENADYSLHEQEQFIREFREKRRRLDEEIPRERIKRAHGAISAVAAVMVIMISVLIVIATVFSIMRVKNRRKNQMQTLDILEQYYQNRQFEEMRDYYYNSSDTYSATYDKYYYLGDIWYWYSCGSEFLADDVKYFSMYDDGSDVFRENISHDLGYLFRGLSMLDELEANGFVYNEEDAALYLRSLITDLLKGTYGFTDEEIEQATARYEDFDTDYGDLADRIMGRAD